jgi:hypothetical protein
MMIMLAIMPLADGRMGGFRIQMAWREGIQNFVQPKSHW